MANLRPCSCKKENARDQIRKLSEISFLAAKEFGVYKLENKQEIILFRDTCPKEFEELHS